MVLFFTCMVCQQRRVGSAGQRICSHCVKKLKCSRCEKKLSGDGREFEIVGNESIVCVVCLADERFRIISEEIEELFSTNKITASTETSGDQKFINSLIPGLTGDSVGLVLTFLSFPKELKNLYLVSKGFKDFFDHTNFFFIQENFGDPDATEQNDETIKDDLLQLCRMKNFRGFGHLKRLKYENLSVKGLLFFLHFIPNSVNSLESVNTWSSKNELHPQLTDLFMNKVINTNVKCCRIEVNLVEKVFQRKDGKTIDLESMRNMEKLWIEGGSVPKYKFVFDFTKNKNVSESLQTLVLSNCRMHKLENVEDASQLRSLVVDASRSVHFNFGFPKLERLEIRKDTMLTLRNLSSIKNVNGMKSIRIVKAGPLNPNGFVMYPNLEELVIPDSLFTVSRLENFFSVMKNLRHLELLSILLKYFKIMLEDGIGLKYVKIHRSIVLRDEHLLDDTSQWVKRTDDQKILLDVKDGMDERLVKKIKVSRFNVFIRFF